MAVEIITSSENVDVGLKLETTPGVIETGAAYDVFETTGGELEFPTEEARDNTVGDHGGPKDKRTTTRGGNANFPMHLGYKRNTALMASALRDSLATAVTIVGASDIDMLVAGTHQDGSTGLQIKGPGAAFDDLITYGGVTANGAEGLLLLMEGWDDAPNNQPVGVKAVWNDGTNDLIDIPAGYGGAIKDDGGGVTSPDTAALFGAPKVGATLQSPTLRAGEALRNRQSGSQARDAYSILVDFFEHSDRARFIGLRGWVGNDLNVSVNGKGEVMVTVNGNGRGWTPLQRTPPNGEAIGSHLDFTALTNNRMMIGADDLQFLAIATYANQINANAVALLLSDANLSAYNINTAGNVQVVGDIIGTDENVPRKGMHDPGGDFTWYNTDALIAEQITQLGQKGTAQLGAVHLAFKDDDDQWVIFSTPRVNFQQTGPSPGAGGNAVSGTQNFGAIALSKNAGAIAVQQIDAGA